MSLALGCRYKRPSRLLGSTSLGSFDRSACSWRSASRTDLNLI
ncbi:hypothetical protein ACC730_26455 [Rhizobium ruizarguesonis]